MLLHRMEVSGFRGFAKPGRINFAVPNGQTGSGLTIITGGNNSGKSSIVECLQARSGGRNQQHPSFHMGIRNHILDTVSITYQIDKTEEVLRSRSRGSSDVIRENFVPDFRIRVVPSRRSFDPYFQKHLISNDDYNDSQRQLQARRMHSLGNFSSRIIHRLEQPGEFNDLLEAVMGERLQWTIDSQPTGDNFIKFIRGDVSHSSDGVGEGIVSLFVILDQLADLSKNDAICIDEPELSLHPSLQRTLVRLLSRIAATRQVIVATHSPYFVDIDSIVNDGVLARVVSTENAGSEIFQLKGQALDDFKVLARPDRSLPHLLGTDAREILFQSDNVIITEGQEDVVLFPHLASQVGKHITGTFFGWGAGGAEKIEKVCRVLQGLGYRKVVGILDNDMTKHISGLEKQFGGYRFLAIPADDIRDKPEEKERKAKSGLLTSDDQAPYKLALRQEYEKPVRALFEDISAYFKPRKSSLTGGAWG